MISAAEPPSLKVEWFYTSHSLMVSVASLLPWGAALARQARWGYDNQAQSKDRDTLVFYHERTWKPIANH